MDRLEEYKFKTLLDQEDNKSNKNAGTPTPKIIIIWIKSFSPVAILGIAHKIITIGKEIPNAKKAASIA